MTDLVKEALADTVRDGILIGIAMAMDALKAAQPFVDPANQTWDSAVAVLNLTKAEYEQRRLALTPATGGEA